MADGSARNIGKAATSFIASIIILLPSVDIDDCSGNSNPIPAFEP
jgi:hypothetical protein